MRCFGRRGIKTTERWPCTLDARLCTQGMRPVTSFACCSILSDGFPTAHFMGELSLSLPLSAVSFSLKLRVSLTFALVG